MNNGGGTDVASILLPNRRRSKNPTVLFTMLDNVMRLLRAKKGLSTANLFSRRSFIQQPAVIPSSPLDTDSAADLAEILTQHRSTIQHDCNIASENPLIAIGFCAQRAGRPVVRLS